MVSRTEALDLVLAAIAPLETVHVPLEQALGFALAKDIQAPHGIPPVDRSAMDGYALSSKETAPATPDLPVRFKVVGEGHPGTKALPALGPKETVAIMTGGAMPSGADTVVKHEEASRHGDVIYVPNPVRAFVHVSRKGHELAEASLVASRGTILSPILLAILAGFHITQVPVTRRPTVSILVIGNEFAEHDAPPSSHKIVATNLTLLSGLVQEAGGLPGSVKTTEDDKQAIRAGMEEGLRADLLITTGGTAMARTDLTSAVMEEMGMDIRFAGISMLPGKGTLFALHKGKPVLALPGRPSAVFAAFHCLVRPAIKRLMGTDPEGLYRLAVLEAGIEKRPGMEHLVQGRVTGHGNGYRVFPLTGPETSVFDAMARSNGFVLVGPDETRLEKGTPVPVLLFGAIPFSQSPEQGPKKGLTAPPCISVVGKSDSGKTTLLEKLIPALRAKGYRVGTIKHDVHGFDIDREGKDTWRHKQAGANTVVISSPAKVAVIKDVDREETPAALASRYFRDVDIVMTEGYKRGGLPKIEIFRQAVHTAPLCRKEDNLVALVSDVPLDLGVPRFGLEDVDRLADFIENAFLLGDPVPQDQGR